MARKKVKSKTLPRASAQEKEAQAEQEAVEAQNTANALQALHDDWPAKHKQIAPYITQSGKVRGGIPLADQKRGREILRSYGL